MNTHKEILQLSWITRENRENSLKVTLTVSWLFLWKKYTMKFTEVMIDGGKHGQLMIVRFLL